MTLKKLQALIKKVDSFIVKKIGKRNHGCNQSVNSYCRFL